MCFGAKGPDTAKDYAAYALSRIAKSEKHRDSVVVDDETVVNYRKHDIVLKGRRGRGSPTWKFNFCACTGSCGVLCNEVQRRM